MPRPIAPSVDCTTYIDVIPDFNCGPSMAGGIQDISFFSTLGEIATLQTPPTGTQAVAVDEFLIKVPHVMNVGKTFNRLYTRTEDGSLEYESMPAGGWKATFKGFLSGDDAKSNYWANKFQRDWPIFLVPDTNGKLNQVGSAAFRPKVKIKYLAHTISDEKGKGYEYEVMCFMDKKIIYEAIIP
jgi:hypothetical protein